MNVKRLTYNTALFILSVCAVCLSLCGCSGKSSEKSLLETLPANPQLVASVNMNTTFRQANCRVNDNREYILTDAIQRMLEGQSVPTASLINILACMAPVANLDEVVWFIPEGEKLPVVTLLITERKDFEKAIASKSVSSSVAGDYTIFSFPELVVVNNDRQCWISRQADYIFASLDKAAQQCFDPASSAYNFLMKDNDIKITVTLEEGKEFDVDCIATAIDLKNNGIFTTIHGLNADGSYKNIKGSIGLIDTGFMDYVPASSAIIGAFGKINSLDDCMAMINKIMDKQSMSVNLAYQMIADYLHSIDGTTAVALSPIAGSQAVMNVSPSTWEFMFCTSMPADESEEIIETINSYAPLGGVKTRRLDENFYEARYYNDTFMFGAKNGNLIFANYDLNAVRNSIDRSRFENKMAVLCINVPYNSELMKGIGLIYGLDIEASLDEDRINIITKFPGSSTTPFTALIEQYNAIND